jgi:hypothetical protein
MADAKSRVVVEAHALRKATAMAALLHGSRRGPRDLKRPFATLVVSLLLGALLLAAFWGINRVGDLLQQQRRDRAADAASATPAASVDYTWPRSQPPGASGAGSVRNWCTT